MIKYVALHQIAMQTPTQRLTVDATPALSRDPQHSHHPISRRRAAPGDVRP
jgi:hypothetical protein